MKMLLLALTALTLSFGAARADSPSIQFAVVSVPSTLTHTDAPVASTLSSSTNFAQLDTHAHMVPISSGMVLALIALFVLALRIMGVNHARAMADHERHSHHGKAQMFRSLHEKHSSR